LEEDWGTRRQGERGTRGQGEGRQGDKARGEMEKE